jgi:hypothetical protein
MGEANVLSQAIVIALTDESRRREAVIGDSGKNPACTSYVVNSGTQTKLIQLPTSLSKNRLKLMELESAKCGRTWPRRLAWCALLTLSPIGVGHADAVTDAYQHLQQQPQSVALNLQYALEAEKAGKLKWALPAYERALAAEPGNKEALKGIDRIRSKLRAEAEAQ